MPFSLLFAVARAQPSQLQFPLCADFKLCGSTFDICLDCVLYTLLEPKMCVLENAASQSKSINSNHTVRCFRDHHIFMSCSFMMKTHGSFQAIVNARDLLNYLHETLISRVSESPPPRNMSHLYSLWWLGTNIIISWSIKFKHCAVMSPNVFSDQWKKANLAQGQHSETHLYKHTS